MVPRKTEHDGNAMHEIAEDVTPDYQLSRDLEALRSVTEDRLPSLGDTERLLRSRVRARGGARRKLLFAAGIAALGSTALAAPLLLELSSPQPKPPAQNKAIANDAVPAAATPARTNVETAVHIDAARKKARTQRDALRAEIVRHTAVIAATKAVSEPRWERPSQPTDLANKLGPGREKLAEFLNDHFSPLLAECVEHAEGRSPDLAGMFYIGIETLAYEELGAVVDVAEPTDRNQLADPLFVECVRESAFTLIIPPPLTSGQEKFEVNGFFGRRPAAEE